MTEEQPTSLAARLPGLAAARHRAGQFVAPEFRGHIGALYESVLQHNHELIGIEGRFESHEGRLESHEGRLESLE